VVGGVAKGLRMIAALAWTLALCGCYQPPSAGLVKACASRAGAWRFGRAEATMVLLSLDQDPLHREGSQSAEGAERTPCLACAKQLLERKFPIPGSPGLERVGRLQLLQDGDERCDTFRQDAEAIISAKYYDLKPPPGRCIGLEQEVPRMARYAVASFARSYDGANVMELVDLQTREVLARVVDFSEIHGGDAPPIPLTCRDTPSGAPAKDALNFVLASLGAPSPPQR